MTLSPPQEPRRFLTVRETATLIEASETTVRRMLKTGQLESRRRRPRGWHRILRRSVEAYLRQRP